MHQLDPGDGKPVLITSAVLVEDRRDRRGRRRSRCYALLALPPPGILELAVPASLPLPGFRRPRALLRVLLLEISSMSLLLQPPQLVQGMRVCVPHHHQFHPLSLQVLREVPHELVDLGFPEELLRVFPVDTPTEGEMDGPFPIVLVVQAHQLPECQAPPGCLGPDILPAEDPVRQLQPRVLRHLAVIDLRACRLIDLTWRQLMTHPYPS